PGTVPREGVRTESRPLRWANPAGPGRSSAPSDAIVVTQPLPSRRRTTTTAGTTSEPGDRSSKGRAPTAMGPAPGPPSGDGPAPAERRGAGRRRRSRRRPGQELGDPTGQRAPSDGRETGRRHQGEQLRGRGQIGDGRRQVAVGGGSRGPGSAGAGGHEPADE